MGNPLDGSTAELGRVDAAVGPAAEFLRLADSALAADDHDRAYDASVQAICAYLTGDLSDRRAILTALAEVPAVSSRRTQLFRRLESVAAGTRVLIAMRRDALAYRLEEPSMDAVERDLRQQLSTSFAPANLVFRAIDGSSPATVLEHVVNHDAVHPISGWDELRRRLGPTDRRCFGLFHQALPDRPVAFTEVALTSEMPTSIDGILDPDRTPVSTERATSAVFYSISSSEPGLRGIRFGEALLERSIAALHRDLTHLRAFVTLSPMPGFRQWLADAVASGSATDDLARLHRGLERGLPPADGDDRLRRAAEAYLLSTTREDGRSTDPVARFHLGNGARLERIQLGADLSARGRAQSFGAMACYRYEGPSA
ncbi:malonyl-CoA decarboxylase family protein [Agromyces sp. NPDC049794]|uniref:malonyl-CoA decarboxylase domain-containing protein n=1 Tax=unclassified Agromyces TaxID=2639701 RepID=UPI0033D44345